MPRWFHAHVLPPYELTLIGERRDAFHRTHRRQPVIIVGLRGRWPTQHGTHRMRSAALLLLMLLMHHLLLMHLHVQLLLLLLMKSHQLFLVSVSLHLVRIQIENFCLFVRFLLHVQFHWLPTVVIVTRLLLLLLLLVGLWWRRMHLCLILLLRTITQLLILLMLSGIRGGRVGMACPHVFTQLIRVLVHRTALVTLQRGAPRAGGTYGTGAFRLKMLLMLVRMVTRITSTATAPTPTTVLRILSGR